MSAALRLPEARLIPARAGKTLWFAVSGTTGLAHPRACGENKRSLGAARQTAGSSPRVRGKPIVAPVEHDPPGLIPARAGKTKDALKRKTND